MTRNAPRVFAMLCGALCGVAMAFGQPAQADAAETDTRDSFSLFAGVMTDQNWEEVLDPFSGLDLRDSYLLGGSASREWGLGRFGYFGIEGAIYGHFGDQDLLEFSAPIYLRSRRPERGYIPNIAYGLGVSYTTSVPDVEIDRSGDSQQWLLTWFLELEFRSQAQTRPYIRLHHRSDGFGLLDTDAGSNAVGIGLRRDF
ncbi:MAG: hypothetical protein AAGG56_10365 [Pseudomonadota bacterium]